MKKFRHTRRSVILFFLLGPLTVFIYDIVLLTHVGKDVNRINEGKEGYKRAMNFVGAFFLGFITLGIVPLVWMCKVAGRIGRSAVEYGVTRPHIGTASFFFLFFFFCWTIVCPIIGMAKFLHTLNKTERVLNERADAASKEEAEATLLPEPVVAAEESPKEEVAEVAPTLEENPEEAPAKEAPVEVAPSEDKPEEEQLPFEHVTELPPEEISKDDPRSDVASVYHIAGREEIRKWRVRIPGSETAVKVFDTREEALAYAKGLAARKHATVRIKRS